MSATGRWPRWCVVGIGGHARTKLLPALAANRQQVVGLVSAKPAEALPAAPRFGSLAAALAAVPRDTCFLIASPPNAHAAQALAAAAAGHDAVIEKPAFLTIADAQAAMAAAARNGTVLAEGFMHRHAALHAALVARFATGGVQALDIGFQVPALPEGTFRQERSPAWTCLWDIGCYAVALLADLGLPLDPLRLDAADARGLLTLAGTLDGVRVTARIGVAAAYANAVALTDAGGAVTTYAPFFYGRPGPRTVAGPAGTRTIEEEDAFATMLAVPRDDWHASQRTRWATMLAVTACLERLAHSLSNPGYRR